MKIKIQTLVPVLLAVTAGVLFSCTSGGKTFKTLEDGFAVVPDSIRIGAYWYWISDNISAEGVEKDLEAMKKAGITRVQIGNIGIDDIAPGPVPFMSEEWWNVTRTAMKKASELGIELGMFNSPGWSQSGGPWVKEEQSMRYVATMDTVVSGGTVRMSVPEGGKLVAVLASPFRGWWSREWTCRGQKRIDMNVDSTVTVRSIYVRPDWDATTPMRLFCDGKQVCEFLFDIHNSSVNVGFDLFAPLVLNIPETTGKHFSLEMDEPGDITFKIRLSEEVKVERYAQKSLAKMFQDPLPMWDEYMWDTRESGPGSPGIIPVGDVVDLTSCVSDGILEWTAPEGNWKIAVCSMKTTGITNSPAVPDATGLEADKMSRTHIASHFEAYLGKILERIPAQERTSFKISVMDSYEMGSENWTDDMRDVFEETYGYDPVPYLPVLQGCVVESQDISDRFLWDLRRLVADRVAIDYVGGLRDVCHKHGLTTWLENYGHWGFPGEFLLYGSRSDEVAGEFWSNGDLGNIENRAASSCAHIYGKKRVWSESCTSGGPYFQQYPAVMKKRIDRFFCEGINSTLLHLYIQQPDDRMPGIAAWFGNEFNRNNTWFRDMDLFTSYLRRCNYMLQQGDYVADVAYFIGEDAPKMTGICSPELPEGYSFDYINGEVLKKHSRVENGQLALDSGMKYRVLVLPPQNTIRPEMLECIASLVKEGLVVTGPKPVRSPSLQGWPDADTRVKSLSDEMWSGVQYGKGKVYPEGTDLLHILESEGRISDFESGSDNADLLFIHRTLGRDGDIYFVSNQEDAAVSVTPGFRVDEGLLPELWNPVTGERRGVPSRYRDSRRYVSLNLDRLESVFVVFRRDAITDECLSEKSVLPLDRTWHVKFRSPFGDEYEKHSSGAGFDWSVEEDDNLKYFSGTATYSYKVSLTSGQSSSSRIELTTGPVMVTGKVRINGTYAGGLWTCPYTVNATGLLKEGNNTIELDITNNWCNRMIGDKISGSGRTWCNTDPFSDPGERHLQKSGIQGPVELVFYE